MDSPREIPIHRALSRPHLLLGADREMVLVAGILLPALAFALRSLWGLLICGAVGLLYLAALIRMAKVDPLMRHKYLRHIKYKPYYPARSGLLVLPSPTPKYWDRRVH